jgi:hypothetical protein
MVMKSPGLKPIEAQNARRRLPMLRTTGPDISSQADFGEICDIKRAMRLAR